MIHYSKGGKERALLIMVFLLVQTYLHIKIQI